MKTLEEYVLARLEDLEKDYDVLNCRFNNTKSALDNEILINKNLIKMLKSIVEKIEFDGMYYSMFINKNDNFAGEIQNILDYVKEVIDED